MALRGYNHYPNYLKITSDEIAGILVSGILLTLIILGLVITTKIAKPRCNGLQCDENGIKTL